MDSSESFKNTTTVPVYPSTLLMLLSIRQIIVVAFVVYTKQSVEPTPPLYDI